MTTEQKVTRKLRAILSADVKGYSLLMAEDEAYTIRTLKEYRSIMSTQIEQHNGRVVDSPGDNVLADFPSAVDAVQCAVEIQKILKVENEDLPDDRKLAFRIGVNIGDIVQDGDRIYGSGVNVAARIEGLSDPGGVCVSRNAYDHIKEKLNFGYEYLGDHEVKNIKDPVRVYKVLTDTEDAGKLVGVKEKPSAKKWIWPLVAAVVVLLGIVAWQYYQKITTPDFEPASVENMSFPLPDKPSIAVLPFINMSEDPKQEFFSDGITEEIITALTKVPKMFVIARNSTFAYKGKPIKVQQVAEDLGVRYILEGSVRKDKDKVRITAQLIDALTGHQLWAERYERNLKDIFAVQDEITLKILMELQVKLTGEQQAGYLVKGTQNLEAYLKLLKGREYSERMNKEANVLAKKMYEEAIDLDPTYAMAYLRLSAAHIMDIHFGSSKSPKKSLQTALDLVQKAIALDDDLAEAYSFLGRIYLAQRRYDEAIAQGERGLAMAPNSDFVHAALAFSLHYAGRPEDAIALYEKAIRLNPIPPVWHLTGLASSYQGTERYDEAIALYKRALQRSPDNLFAHMGLTIIYSILGRDQAARSEAKEVLKIDPKFSLENFKASSLYKNLADTELRIDALRKAGLPAKPPLILPDKPSIAVLPFDNMSDVPEQEYFSDGMTDDIITDLSKIKDLLVISRNSTFTYKGQNKKVPEIAKELNVRYILEGSVRRAGDQVRINAQLIDAKKDHHIWAERFDDTFQNIFELQDRITEKIVSALALKLSPDEANRIASKGTDSTIAHDMYLKGQAHLRRWTPDDLAKAINYFKQAVEVDPDYSQAYVGLAQAFDNNIIGGRAFYIKTGYGYVISRRLMRHYIELAMKKPTPGAYSILAMLEVRRRHYEESINLAEKAVALAPNDADALKTLGRVLNVADRPKVAIKYLKEAIRLNPLEGHLFLGFAYMSMQKYEKALEYAEHSLAIQPKVLTAHIVTAVSYAHLGREEEAKEAFKKYLTSYGSGYPKMQFLYFIYCFKNPDTFNRFVEGLVKAGYNKDLWSYYEVNEANKLNGQEIKELLIGKTTIGEYWVEGDALCQRLEDRFEGVKHCFDVYYNPKGTITEKNQYLMLGDVGITPFRLRNKNIP